MRREGGLRYGPIPFGSVVCCDARFLVLRYAGWNFREGGGYAGWDFREGGGGGVCRLGLPGGGGGMPVGTSGTGGGYAGWDFRDGWRG